MKVESDLENTKFTINLNRREVEILAMLLGTFSLNELIERITQYEPYSDLEYTYPPTPITKNKR